MNVETLINEYEQGNLTEGDTVTVAGEVIGVSEDRTGEYKKPRPDGSTTWSNFSIRLGDGNRSVRITIWNPPSTLDGGDLGGQNLKLKAKVAPYNDELQLSINNIMEQLNQMGSVPTQGDEDVTPPKPDPRKPGPTPPSRPSLSAYRERKLDAVRFYINALNDMGSPDTRAAVALSSGEIIDLNKGVFEDSLDVDPGPSEEDIPF